MPSFANVSAVGAYRDNQAECVGASGASGMATHEFSVTPGIYQVAVSWKEKPSLSTAPLTYVSVSMVWPRAPG